MKLRGTEIMTKLEVLMESEGQDNLEEFCEELMFDSVNPGICMNNGCDYTTHVEPDQTEGWCEVCESNTVKSATELILF